MKHWLRIGGLPAFIALAAAACSQDRSTREEPEPELTASGGRGNSGEGPDAGPSEAPDAAVTAGGHDAGTNSGSGGSEGIGGSLALGLIGTACRTDADCDQPDGVCASVESGIWVGGPAGGYCTAPCTPDATLDACTTGNPNAGCINIGANGEGYCVLTCQQGQPFNLASKCHGRRDLVCDFISPTAGGQRACLPRCGSSEDCPAGSECDLIAGFCGPLEPANEVLGQPCDPSSADFCPCLSLDPSVPTATSTVGVCVGFCSIGSTVACGFDQAPRGSVCLGSVADGSLDLGLCLPSCNCNAECPEGAVCQAADPVAQADFGSAGFCAAPALPLPAADAGLNGEGIAECPEP